MKQLEKYLLQIIADVMNEVGQKVEEKLKEHVQKDVYDVGTDMGRSDYYNGTGEPTGQLKESVVHSKPERRNNEVSTEIYHDSNRMNYDASTFLHGSNHFTPNDVRDMLPYFINEGKTGGLFGAAWENLKRPYLTNTFDEIVSKDLVKVWFVQGLKKRGLKQIK